MRKWYFACLIGLTLACSEKKTDLTGNTPLKINDFNKIFKATTLPITLSDTNLKTIADTQVIGRKALAQFVPDSVIEKIIATKDTKAVIYPLLKIEKENEYYLMFNVHHSNRDQISVVVFSKKNKYLDFKVITDFLNENKGSKLYGKTVSINKEPTFLVAENKMSNENILVYQKSGWAYSDSNFKLIYFDSNKKPEHKTITNPIDTLLTNNIHSGDYARDNKNFLSLRDFNGSPNKYQFFLHFEKKDGTCTGELKGLLNFIKNQASFNEKGDPCIIHFTIQGNLIVIKEDGNCGNHRNMTCYFNDKYDKKRKPKKKK